MAAFVEEREWQQFHTPRNVMLALAGEVGELAAEFQWKPDAACGVGLPGWTPSEREHLGEELADVLLYLVRLAHLTHMDLPAAAARKMRLNAAKYPAHLARGSAAKYTAYAAAAAAGVAGVDAPAAGAAGAAGVGAAGVGAPAGAGKGDGSGGGAAAAAPTGVKQLAVVATVTPTAPATAPSLPLPLLVMAAASAVGAALGATAAVLLLARRR